jgi:hypothetical protein
MSDLTPYLVRAKNSRDINLVLSLIIIKKFSVRYLYLTGLFFGVDLDYKN